MKQIILFFTMLFFTKSIGQNTFNGKLIAENAGGINIINISNYQTSISNNEGLFSIKAKPNDTLQITSNKTKGIQIILKEAFFKETVFNIKTIAKIEELEEVTIKKDKTISAFSLGIIPKKLVTYSPAERRLKAKTKIDSRIGFNDNFNESLKNKNVFSNNSTLVNNLIIERKENLLERISVTYSDEFFINTLKIPSLHIKGFQFYLVENQRFVDNFNAKNSTVITFLLHDLAINYNKRLQNE